MSTLENASAVLNLFAYHCIEQDQGLTLSELSQALALPKSTLSRLLVAMQQQGLLYRDPASRRYSVGHVLVAAGRQAPSLPLAQLVEPALRQLAQRYNCHGYVCHLKHPRIEIIAIISGHRAFPAGFAAGHQLPATKTAAGCALLACFPEREMLEYMVPVGSRVAAWSQAGTPGVMQRLRAARAHGWTYCRDEVRPGMTTLATALIHRQRHERVGLGLAYATPDGPQSVPDDMLNSLLTTTRILAEKIGDDRWSRH